MRAILLSLALAVCAHVSLGAQVTTAQVPPPIGQPAVLTPSSAVNGAGVLASGTLTLGTAGQNGLGISGTATAVKAPDGGAYLLVNNGLVAVNSAVFSLFNAGAGLMLMSTTAPTVTSAGTSPSVVANGSATFRVNVGTGGTATTIVMAMPTATAGWNCVSENLTGNAANRADARMAFQASTTTSVTMQYQTVSTGVAKAFTASDIVLFLCSAY